MIVLLWGFGVIGGRGVMKKDKVKMVRGETNRLNGKGDKHTIKGSRLG